MQQEVTLLLSQEFPIRKYKGMPVAHALQDLSYMRWLHENTTFWTSSPLFKQLVEHKVLLSDGWTLAPMYRKVCLEIINQEKQHPNPSMEEGKKSHCIFCLDPMVSQGLMYAFSPCGHAIICTACHTRQFHDIKKLRTCPVCRVSLGILHPTHKVIL